MPSDSIGFWVAMTRNGAGTACVSRPIVTWRSCITSSSADWTLAGARLISSARTKFVNTGPELGLERAVVGAPDAGADEVARNEVGRELDPLELDVERLRERLDREGLGETGDALEQQVAAREQRDEHALEHRVLADDDPPDLEQQRLGGRARIGGGARRGPTRAAGARRCRRHRRLGRGHGIRRHAAGGGIGERVEGSDRVGHGYLEGDGGPRRIARRGRHLGLRTWSEPFMRNT